MLVRDIINFVEEIAPATWAEKWDNVGLQIGSLKQAVNKVLVAVDPTTPLLDQAVEAGAELIITHHPLFFHPLRRLSFETPIYKIIARAIERNITIYSAHTNLDIAPGGVNTALIKQLALKDVQSLVEVEKLPFCKLAAFVPKGYEEKVRTAMCTALAGQLSNYSHTSFQSPGMATHRSTEYIYLPYGENEILERNPQSKIELTLPCSAAELVLKNIRSVYPSANITFDLYPLHNKPAAMGYGYVGTVNTKPVTFKRFLTKLKKVLQLPYLQMAGKAPEKVHRVAVCGGSGSEFIESAYKSGADVYITAELKHSHARMAEELNFCALDIGHFHSEKFGMKVLAGYIRKRVNDRGLKADVIEASMEKSPIQLIK